MGPIEVEVTPGGAPRPQLWLRDDLRDVKFDAAGYDDINFEDATIEGVDFSGFRFYVFRSSGCRFVDCDFSKTKFKMAGGFSYDPPSTFVGCNFDGADLRVMGSLKATRFERCSFRGSRIEGWRSDCAEFVDNVFATKIVRSRFSGRAIDCWKPVARTTNEFRGNDFRSAEIVDSRFSYGIDIDAQLWPDDPAYIRLDHWPQRLQRARAVVGQWPSSRERDHALLMLEVYGNSGMSEQPVLFTRRDDVRSIPENVRNRVWALLSA